MKLEKKGVQVKTTASSQTKSPKHSFFCGYFYVSLIWVAVLTIEKNTFPDTSYETSMHIKLSVPCQKITVYTSDFKKLMLTCFTRRT